MALIPVTILTGFLGSGKTTLLNQLMQSKGDEKVIVIINEFGDTSIDHELVLVDEQERIFQMNNGCMCCILREDLAETFLSILSFVEDSGIEIDRIIIETSGLADPSPIAQTILRVPTLNERLLIDSILTLVDMKNADYQITHYPELRAQIVFGDLLLLTKVEEISKHKIDELKRKIADINPFVDQLEINGKEVFEELIGLHLFDRGQDNRNIEKDVEHMIHNHDNHHRHEHQHHTHNHDNHHKHTPASSFVIQTDIPISEHRVMNWIRELIQQYGMNLMRYKGFLQIEGVEKPIILQGVNMAFRLEEGERWLGTPATKLVLIGKDLPENEIKNLLLKQ